MGDSYEESVIEFESNRNEAMDKYFNARQGLSRTKVQEDIFEGGFRMAWDFLKEDKGCALYVDFRKSCQALKDRDKELNA